MSATARRIAPPHRAAILVGLLVLVAIPYFAIGHTAARSPWAAPAWLCGDWGVLSSVLPLVPWLIIPYLSLWILWWMPIWKASDVEFMRLVLAITLARVVAFTFFLACWKPAPRPDPQMFTGALQWLYLGLHVVDPARNAFPSLHATDAVLLAGHTVSRGPASLIMPWASFVILSSVLIGQHTPADVVAGIALAAVVTAISARVPLRTTAGCRARG